MEMQKIYQDLILHRKITKLTPNKKYKILNKNYLILLSNKKMNLLKSKIFCTTLIVIHVIQYIYSQNIQLPKVLINSGIASEIWGMQFSPNGNLLAISGNRVVKIVDSKFGCEIISLSLNISHIHDFVFSENNKYLAFSGGEPSIIFLFDLERLKISTQIEGSYPYTFSKDSKKFAYCDDLNVFSYGVTKDTLKTFMLSILGGNKEWSSLDKKLLKEKKISIMNTENFSLIKAVTTPYLFPHSLFFHNFYL